MRQFVSMRVLVLTRLLCLHVFAQTSSCDCIVKLENNNHLKLMLNKNSITTNLEIPKLYTPLLSDKENTPNYLRIKKDSAMFWFIETNPFDNIAKRKVVKTRKLVTTYEVRLNFKTNDSIPCKLNPKKEAVITSYLKPNDSLGDDFSFWFAGCNIDYVRILLLKKNKMVWVPKNW